MHKPLTRPNCSDSQQHVLAGMTRQNKVKDLGKYSNIEVFHTHTMNEHNNILVSNDRWEIQYESKMSFTITLILINILSQIFTIQS